MAKKTPKESTWWDWCTRIIAVTALVMSLLNFFHDRQKTKVAYALAASQLNDKAWEELGGERGAQDIADGQAANRPAARNIALNHVEQGLTLLPDDPDLLSTKGVILAEQGDLDGARRFYNKALAVGPRDVTAYTGLGVMLQNEKRTDEAIALYNRAIGASLPQLWNVYYNLGDAYIQKREFEKAEAAFRKAIGQKRDFADAFDGLAASLEKQNRADEGRDARTEAKRLRQALAAGEAPAVAAK